MFAFYLFTFFINRPYENKSRVQEYKTHRKPHVEQKQRFLRVAKIDHHAWREWQWQINACERDCGAKRELDCLQVNRLISLVLFSCSLASLRGFWQCVVIL